jgi:hypothetical protein
MHSLTFLASRSGLVVQSLFPMTESASSLTKQFSSRLPPERLAAAATAAAAKAEAEAKANMRPPFITFHAGPVI